MSTIHLDNIGMLRLHPSVQEHELQGQRARLATDTEVAC